MTLRSISLLLVALLSAALTAGAAEPRVYRAAADFTLVDEPSLARPYVEKKAADASTHGLAVNPKTAKDNFAAAEIVYRGEAGRATLRLIAVAEEDGESVYDVEVDGKRLGTRTNPRVKEKRVVTTHEWKDVSLTPGSRIRVLFSGRSNGLYPEGDAFAWSRGRWRALEVR